MHGKVRPHQLVATERVAHVASEAAGSGEPTRTPQALWHNRINRA